VNGVIIIALSLPELYRIIKRLIVGRREAE